MSSAIDIGTLQGTLSMRNAYSAEFDKFNSEIKEKLTGGVKRFSEATEKETAKIHSAYLRVASSLDPVTANTIKYQRAEQALTAALKAGIITQNQYNHSLDQAKNKYLSSSASTLTWREEMQRLTSVIAPFATRLANISVVAREVQGALLGSAKASNAVAGSNAAATTSFTSLYAAALPIVAILGSIAVVAGSIFVAFKGFSFLSSVTQEGVKTQLVIEKLNNTLLATGSYAQLSSAQLVTLAESYELLSGKSKEEIIAAETILARFETLNNQVYPEALRMTLSYAKAMGVSAEAAASKLGPALEGNTRALGSLKEAGIVLSASQRKTLQGMIDGGKVAEYQAKLLEVLREKVSGLSTEYDENLSRQGERAKIVLQDFGEAIANEVIPAIEDLVQNIVSSLGGWDALKAKVNEVGGAIGNFIRTYLYGLGIAYHDVMATIDIFIARHNTLLRVLSTPLKVFTGGQEIIKSQKEAQKDVAEHARSIATLTNRFNEHRVALEGNTQVYQSHGSAIDDVIGKNAQLDKLMEELTEIYRDQTLELERIFALRMLAAKGPFSEKDRLAEERKINEAHKDRILFLQQEVKFGTQVAQSLAKQREQLKDLEKKMRVELTLATKLEPIEVKDVRINLTNIKPIELNAEDLLSLEAIENFKSEMRGVADNWKESLKSIRDIAEEEMEDVRDAVRLGFLTVSEGEAAIARIRADMYSAQVDQWSGFVDSISGMLSELGGSFGRFMSQIASAAQSIQGVNSTAQSLGGWASAMGAFGGTIAAFVEVYKYGAAMIAKHDAEKFGTGVDFSLTGGIEGTSYFSQAGLELIRSIRSIVEQIEDQLRISVSDLDQIAIKVSNDGKQTQAWVKGVWIGTFADTNTAIREALLVAMKDPSSSLGNMSQLMIEGISQFTAPDTEALLQFLGQLRTISDLTLSPAVVSLQQSTLEINRLREALNKLASSQAVIDAHNDLNEAQKRLYDQTKASLLGIDLASINALRDLAGFQKGIESVGDSIQAGLLADIEDAQKELDNLNRKKISQGGEGGFDGTPGLGGGDGSNDPNALFMDTVVDVDSARAKLEKAIAEWTKQLGEIPKALTKDELNLGVFTAFEQDMRKSGKYAEEIARFEQIRVKLKYEEIRLQLVTMGLWQEWAAIWSDLYNQAMNDAAKGGVNVGGGGKGTGGKASIKDFIKDTKFELSLIGLTDYQKSLAELDRQYDDLIKQAGKDKKLKQELLALKEQEQKQLTKEAAASTQGKFREFLGLVTPFDKVRKTATDLIKEIEGSPFGDARKANMIGRVLSEIDKQVTKMSKEMAVGLFGNMLSDMQQFGATEEQMRNMRMAQATLEHELKMIDYAQTIALLELENKVSAEVLANLRAGLNFLSSIDPTQFIGNISSSGSSFANDNFSSSVESSFDDIHSGLKSIQDKIAEWNRIPLSETLERAHELTDSFASLMEDVRKVKEFGRGTIDLTKQVQSAFKNMVRGFIDDTLSPFEESGSELENQLRGIGAQFKDINLALIHLGATHTDLERAERARLSSVQRALDEYLNPIRERRLSRLVGDRSILTGEQQYFNAQQQFRDLFSSIESGDLTNLANVVTLADQYEDLIRSYTGGEGLRFGLKEIDDTLLAIENIVPGFAQEMADIGTESNPMYMDSSSMVSAINENMEAVNTGNSLMLTELRSSVSEMRQQTVRLANIEQVLSMTTSVREVA